MPQFLNTSKRQKHCVAFIQQPSSCMAMTMRQSLRLPVEASLNCTARGTCPVVGVALESATGVGVEDVPAEGVLVSPVPPLLLHPSTPRSTSRLTATRSDKRDRYMFTSPREICRPCRAQEGSTAVAQSPTAAPGYGPARQGLPQRVHSVGVLGAYSIS